ncbi:MAG: magnesium transporter [Verrucomicrobia bacterium]|nr:magnesium transporter [Verrucomicrobiota bacterium]MBS0636215.1 magnesium transporter [Verrucomicrobiota bacterium]
MDSPTSQINDLLDQKLESAFHMQTSQVMLHDLAKIAIEHDPIDLAYAVTRLPTSVRHVVFQNLPNLDAKVIFISNVSENSRSAILRQTSDSEIVRLVDNMAPDDAAWVLEGVTERRCKRILDLVDKAKAERIRELLSHGLDSAGRLMTNEFFAFPMQTTIRQVAANIRDNPGIELTQSIFVLNDEQELVGIVPSRNLIVNSKDLPIRQVMGPVPHKIGPDAPRDEVVDLMERYKLAILPVVDQANKLVGVVTGEDIVEVMEDIADETIASIGGTAEDLEEDDPIWTRFLLRAPWLFVTLLAGLVTACGLAHFQEAPWFAVVPFFVPLITGMSGNVGIQCSTLFVRGIATGEVSSGRKRELVMREIGIGSLIGLIFGLMCGVMVYALNRLGAHQVSSDSFIVGSIVSCGVFGACMTATLLGSISPLFFARVGVDPAVASGPIVTACNDVLSTFMYFLVAKLMYMVVYT